MYLPVDFRRTQRESLEKRENRCYNDKEVKLQNNIQEETIVNSSDYNKYLAAVKAANDVSDESRCRELLRSIYADMVARFGAGDSDVEYLFRMFRLHI